MQGLRPFFRYFDFSGRAGRAEYWQFFALCFICSSFLWLVELNSVLASTAAGIPKIPLWSTIFGLLTFIPAAAAAFRRLHDRNKSGWLIGGFYGFMTVGAIVLMIGGAQAETGEAGTMLPLGLAFVAVMLIVGVYIIVQLALPGDEFENDFGWPDNEPFDIHAALGSRKAITRGPTLPRANPSRLEDDPLARIERLAELHSKGHLTAEEFAAQKARLLEGLA